MLRLLFNLILFLFIENFIEIEAEPSNDYGYSTENSNETWSDCLINLNYITAAMIAVAFSIFFLGGVVLYKDFHATISIEPIITSIPPPQINPSIGFASEIFGILDQVRPVAGNRLFSNILVKVNGVLLSMPLNNYEIVLSDCITYLENLIIIYGEGNMDFKNLLDDLIEKLIDL